MKPDHITHLINSGSVPRPIIGRSSYNKKLVSIIKYKSFTIRYKTKNLAGRKKDVFHSLWLLKYLNFFDDMRTFSQQDDFMKKARF